MYNGFIDIGTKAKKALQLILFEREAWQVHVKMTEIWEKKFLYSIVWTLETLFLFHFMGNDESYSDLFLFLFLCWHGPIPPPKTLTGHLEKLWMVIGLSLANNFKPRRSLSNPSCECDTLVSEPWCMALWHPMAPGW